MGYQTDFEGAFTFEVPLEDNHRLYLKAFNETRRVARDPIGAAKLADPIREAVGLPIGEPDACYFVGGQGYMGQDHDYSVITSNEPPGGARFDMVMPTGEVVRNSYSRYPFGPLCEKEGPHRGHGCEYGIYHKAHPDAQPGLWCQWAPTEDGTQLVWDQGEKFYHYVPWLAYLRRHFLDPWGYELRGEVYWRGEDDADFGRITVVEGNRILVAEGSRDYGPTQEYPKGYQ